LGGLPKKISQIKNLGAENPENMLLLDSGNLLFKRKKIMDGPSQERLTASTIIEIYQDNGYDAVAVGPLDLAAGKAFIEESSSNGFPWVSANIMNSSGDLLFKPWRTKTIADTRIVITAITGSPHRNIPGIKILPWEEALGATLKRISEETEPQFIILLSSLKSDENKRITELFPEINLIISADLRLGNISPKLYENCLIAQTAKQGKYQGLLEILFGKQRIWGQDTVKVVADLQNKLGSLNWQLRRLTKKAAIAGNEDKYTNTISSLKKKKEKLDNKILSAKETLAQEKITGVLSDQYSNRFLGLKKNMPNDQQTIEKLTILNNQIKELHKKNKNNKNITKNLSKLTKDLVGHAVCETCHEVQAEFWKTTAHSSAYATLVNKNKSLDLSCLPCHLTIPPSSLNMQNLPNEVYLSYPEPLHSVGCESCHGPGKQHTIAPETSKLTSMPSETLCLDCHTPEHDDNFVYTTKLGRIACPSE